MSRHDTGYAISANARTYHKLAAYARREGISIRAAADRVIGAVLDAQERASMTPDERLEDTAARALATACVL